jgi:hypothetical protein
VTPRTAVPIVAGSNAVVSPSGLGYSVAVNSSPNFSGTVTANNLTATTAVAGGSGSFAGTLFGSAITSSTIVNTTSINTNTLVASGNVSTTGVNFGAATLNTYTLGPNPFFSVTLNFGGSPTGFTYGRNDGSWIRIGNICFYNLNIELTAKGSGTGQLSITGFPFTPTDLCTVAINYTPGVFLPPINVTPNILSGAFDNLTPELFIQATNAANGTFGVVDQTWLSNTSQFFFSGFFFC